MTNSSTPIEYFKKESKKLFRQVKANEADALTRVRRVLTDISGISLMRAQHVVAVEFGFSKWEELVGAPSIELQSLIAKKKIKHNHLKKQPSRIGTPLGNFFRGSGIIPTPPHLAALADMFDMMTQEEQRRYLDEDAKAMGWFNRH